MMKGRRLQGRRDQAVNTSTSGGGGRYDESREVLKQYLVLTREIPNGKDFLFLGPRDILHEALMRIVDFEQRSKRFSHIDFAEVNAYYLLRVVGREKDQHLISRYLQ